MKYNSIRKFKKRFKSVCSGVSDFHLLVNMSDFGDTNKFKTDLIKKNMIDTHHIINGYNLYITKLAMLEFYIIGYYLKKFNEDYVFNILTGLKESDLNYNYFSNLKSKLYSNIVNINFDSNIVEYYKGNELISNTSLVKTTKSGKYYNGESAGSEPEIKAAMYFMLKHYKNTYAYINLHSQGRVLYAGKPNLSDEFNKITSTFAKKISSINGYKVHGLSSEEVGEGNDGSATDFMAELANGFIFSSKTLRLSTDKYKDNSCELKYKYPVITMEITNKWTSDPSVFKEEYYDKKLKKVMYELLNK